MSAMFLGHVVLKSVQRDLRLLIDQCAAIRESGRSPVRIFQDMQAPPDGRR
jgi:hypothetical protein